MRTSVEVRFPLGASTRTLAAKRLRAADAVLSGPGVLARAGYQTAWSFSERKALLLTVDLAVLLAAMLSGQTIRDSQSLQSDRPIEWSVLMVMLWVITARAFDCYDLLLAARLRSILPRIAAAAIVVLVAFTLVPYWSPPLPEARSTLVMEAVLALGPLLLWRTAYVVFLSRAAFRFRALIVGDDPVTHSLLGILWNADRRDVELVGSIHANRLDAERLLEAVGQTGANKIIVGPFVDIEPGARAKLLELAEKGVRVQTANQVVETLTGRVILPSVSVDYLTTVSQAHGAHAAIRRSLDILVGLVGLCLSWPVLLIAAGAVMLEDGPPALYRQERTGRYGRTFRIVKLRTMRQDAEPNGQAVWALHRDPRVTRVGAFLRRTRLDELPQLWNVLVGDMTLIGPRPERPMIIEQLNQRIPMYRARHVVAPGLTGWAQVMFRYGASVEDAAAKLDYDLYYIQHRSLLLDATILLKTVGIVVRLQGR